MTKIYLFYYSSTLRVDDKECRVTRLRATMKPALLNCQHMVVDLGDAVDAAQPHGHAEFIADDIDRLGDAGAAEGAEAINIGPADHAGFGAERERPHHVLARANAAVEQHLELRAHRLGDLRQYLDRRRRAVELPAAMVGHHQ